MLHDTTNEQRQFIFPTKRSKNWHIYVAYLQSSNKCRLPTTMRNILTSPTLSTHHNEEYLDQSHPVYPPQWGISWPVPPCLPTTMRNILTSPTLSTHHNEEYLDQSHPVYPPQWGISWPVPLCLPTTMRNILTSPTLSTHHNEEYLDQSHSVYPPQWGISWPVRPRPGQSLAHSLDSHAQSSCQRTPSCWEPRVDCPWSASLSTNNTRTLNKPLNSIQYIFIITYVVGKILWLKIQVVKMHSTLSHSFYEANDDVCITLF